MYDRGVVVVAADPFGNTPRRPYALISDDSHPFSGEQYLALGITTKQYEQSFDLTGSFETGELERRSFVSPWAVVSIRDVHIDRAVARLDADFVDTVTAETVRYLAPT